jgi:hypothetical protein
LSTEQELREKLRRIAALFEGATSTGEHEAAEIALNRVRAALAATEKIERSIKMSFRLPDPWKRRASLALCRRYDLRPYRYPRQRYSTILVRAPESFINRTLRPEYLEISRALDEYLREATERIIREEVFGNADEAEEQPETSPGLQIEESITETERVGGVDRESNPAAFVCKLSLNYSRPGASSPNGRSTPSLADTSGSLLRSGFFFLSE